MPNVVHVIDELPPDGAERLLADVLSQRSSRYDYSVVCVVRGGALEKEIVDMGVPVTVLGRRSRADPVALLRLARLLRRGKADVVHTHLSTADLYGRLAALLAGTPAIFTTVHSTNDWKGALHRVSDRLLARISTRVIACTAQVAEVLRSRDAIAEERIVVISNGIAVSRLAGVDAADDVRAELGVDADEPLVALVGRLHPAKGHDTLIEAFARRVASGARGTCLLIGTGELEPDLRRDVEARGLASRVRFLGHRRDVVRLLRAIDVLAMPSRWEGLPMTLLEAMAMRKPVVATAVGGIPDVVVDGKNGLLIPPSDVGALGAALDRLLADPDLRARLGESAWATVRGRFDVARTSAQYEALYDEALGIGATSAAAGSP